MDTWVIYFATLVGWQHHPGNAKYAGPKFTLEECAEIADRMLEITNRRRPKCQSDSPASPSQD